MNTFLPTPFCPYAFRCVDKPTHRKMPTPFVVDPHSSRAVAVKKAIFLSLPFRKNNPNMLSILPTIIRDEPDFRFYNRSRMHAE